MNVTIRCGDLSGERIERAARAIGHRSAGFGDDERGGRDVPRMEFPSPKRLEATRGNETQVERRRAKPPYSARASEKLGEDLHQTRANLWRRLDGVGEARDQQCIAEGATR